MMDRREPLRPGQSNKLYSTVCRGRRWRRQGGPGQPGQPAICVSHTALALRVGLPAWHDVCLKRWAGGHTNCGQCMQVWSRHPKGTHTPTHAQGIPAHTQASHTGRAVCQRWRKAPVCGGTRGLRLPPRAHLRLVHQQVHLVHQHNGGAPPLAPAAAAAAAKHALQRGGRRLRTRAVPGEGLQGGVGECVCWWGGVGTGECVCVCVWWGYVCVCVCAVGEGGRRGGQVVAESGFCWRDGEQRRAGSCASNQEAGLRPLGDSCRARRLLAPSPPRRARSRRAGARAGAGR